MAIFRRAWRVTIDTIQTSDLDIQFNVVRSLKKDPNTCELTIYNLTESHRRQLQGLRRVGVRLEAGYEGRMFMVYSGDLRNVHTERNGPDFATKITSGDGERALRGRRINRSHAPGVDLSSVLSDAARTLGVGIGNALEAVRSGDLEGAGRRFTEGVVMSGPASEELDGMLTSAGFEWSIQDGNLQVLQRGRALAGTAVRLAPDTGLIGTPTVSAKGVVSAKALLVPDLFPGRKVLFESVGATGLYRVEKVTYQGDTRGTDWYADMECKVPA